VIGFFFPKISFGAITPGTGASSTFSSTDVSENIRYNVAAGSNIVLFVGVISAGQAATASYNGVPMTNLFSRTDGATADYISGFILVNPTTGSNTTTISYITNNGSASGVWIQSWYGVGQGNSTGTTWRRPATNNDGGSKSANAIVTVASSTSGDTVIDVFQDFNGVSSTASSSQTVQWSFNKLFGGAMSGGTSYEAATGATTMQWTLSTSTFWAIGAVSLIPATVSTGPVGRIVGRGISR